jgi:hypothetical protein
MKYNFILYIFGIADVHIFCYILGQSLEDPTFLKNYTQHILEWMECIFTDRARTFE